MPTCISRAGLAKPEDVLIKLGCLLQIVNLDRDVNDARHASSSSKFNYVLMRAAETGHGIPPSFDHLVGAGEQRRRHLNAERLGSLEVNHQLELDWRLDGKLARFRAV